MFEAAASDRGGATSAATESNRSRTTDANGRTSARMTAASNPAGQSKRPNTIARARSPSVRRCHRHIGAAADRSGRSRSNRSVNSGGGPGLRAGSCRPTGSDMFARRAGVCGAGARASVATDPCRSARSRPLRASVSCECSVETAVRTRTSLPLTSPPGPYAGPTVAAAPTAARGFDRLRSTVLAIPSSGVSESRAILIPNVAFLPNRRVTHRMVGLNMAPTNARVAR